MSSAAFKDIIRIVGRGRKLQRDLTTEEAATDAIEEGRPAR